MCHGAATRLPSLNAMVHVPWPSSGLGKATVGNSGSGCSWEATGSGAGNPNTCHGG